jgi:2-oxoglutarate dehydrogenase E2 component (dihydrolipoamide succinyltransferase)
MLEEIRVKEGDVVQAEEVLALMKTGVATGVTKAKKAPSQDPAAATSKMPAKTDRETVIAPGARRLVKELKLDPTKIAGSGKGGRVLKSDVMKYLDEREQERPRDELEAFRSDKALSAKPGMTGEEGRPEQRVPMTRLRARVAERLIQAQQTAAILTTFNEVSMQPVMDLRAKYRERFEKQHEVRLGFMSFFVKAAVEALKRFPVVNASVDGNDIIYHGYYDIGIAVSSPRGLVVPVLRDCEHMSFADIEHGIRDFGKKAQEGTLSYEDLSGGTFSITNGGIFGSMLSTPILNPPQSAILGMHAITERPVAENGQVTIRPVMYLALSYDHRIVDGREAVQCLLTIKECLEDPARLLLQI